MNIAVQVVGGDFICVNAQTIEILMDLGYTSYPECTLQTVYDLLMAGF